MILPKFIVAFVISPGGVTEHGSPNVIDGNTGTCGSNPRRVFRRWTKPINFYGDAAATFLAIAKVSNWPPYKYHRFSIASVFTSSICRLCRPDRAQDRSKSPCINTPPVSPWSHRSRYFPFHCPEQRELYTRLYQDNISQNLSSGVILPTFPTHCGRYIRLLGILSRPSALQVLSTWNSGVALFTPSSNICRIARWGHAKSAAPWFPSQLDARALLRRANITAVAFPNDVSLSRSCCNHQSNGSSVSSQSRHT